MYLLCANDNYGLVPDRAWREVGNIIRKYMKTEEDLHLYDTYKYNMNGLVTCNMCIDQCTCSIYNINDGNFCVVLSSRVTVFI